MLGDARILVGDRVAEALEQVIHPTRGAVMVVERAGGDDQAEDHAGERGVDAGLPEGEPEEDAADRVGAEVPHADPLEQQQEGDRADHPGQPFEANAFAVEDGDDQDAADVIGDGQGEQEDLELHGDARTEQG